MILRLCLALLVLCFSGVAWSAEATTTLDKTTLDSLSASRVGDVVEIASFPIGPGRFGAVSFERIEVLAPGAKIIVVGPDGEHVLPRSRRVHLVGQGLDGNARVGLSFDPDLRVAPSGAGTGIDGEFVLRAERAGAGWTFSAITLAASLPPGVELHFPENEDSVLIANNRPTALDEFTRALQPQPSGTGPARVAVIGVDTDASLLLKRFGDSTTSAATWIADLFVQLNVIYQRDLNVLLQQGTTFLRPGTDPYVNADTVASQAQLQEFGNYWQANYTTGGAAVSRSFAMLLSGNSAAANSASGIAWVNSYCQTQGFGGSYSTNQVFTNSQISIVSSNAIVAHEIGHNFGARHTHCSSLATGTGPVATGTIDQCYNGEAGQSCYAGTPSCPSGGSGSLMSYCHFGAPNGAACGTNQQQFHPSHISYLLTRVAANTPSCFSTNSIIFANGFE